MELCFEDIKSFVIFLLLFLVKITPNLMKLVEYPGVAPGNVGIPNKSGYHFYLKLFVCSLEIFFWFHLCECNSNLIFVLLDIPNLLYGETFLVLVSKSASFHCNINAHGNHLNVVILI